MIAPALVTLAANMTWTGEFGEGERWLQRTERALQTDTGPGVTLLLHMANGMLQAGRGRHREALEAFSAAEHLGSQLAGSHALASQVTGWMLATQARGRPGEARASLAALDDERVGSGEVGNARAVISLAEGDPAGALGAVQDVLDGTAPVIGSVTVVVNSKRGPAACTAVVHASYVAAWPRRPPLARGSALAVLQRDEMTGGRPPGDIEVSAARRPTA
jgi:LuxR family maltose regulon positive regulatory protein